MKRRRLVVTTDIASRQQVLFAEQDVQVTLDELEQARRRTARCRQ